MILSSRSESFSKTVMFLWLLNFSKVTTKHTENMTKITQNRWYAKSPSVPFVARQRTLTSIASKICMSHIIIWNLFLLHTSEDFLSTYYSSLTFLKAAKSGGKDSHAFNTEGFLRLLNSFEIIFRQETSIICTTAEVTEANFKCFFFTFYWQKCFCLECWRSKVLPFHCKSTEWAGSSVVCSLEVGIEAIQWKILFVWEFFLWGTFWFTLVCYSMSTCMISMSSITLD